MGVTVTKYNFEAVVSLSRIVNVEININRVFRLFALSFLIQSSYAIQLNSKYLQFLLQIFELGMTHYQEPGPNVSKRCFCMLCKSAQSCYLWNEPMSTEIEVRTGLEVHFLLCPL